MQYFLPFWPADGIYDKFDPINEIWSGKRRRIWEIFEKPPIDGVLVSLENLKRNKKLLHETEVNGIHKSIRYNGTIMADCGAFTYKHEDLTPDPIETLENYIKYRFNVGVTVDHLIVNKIKGEKLTLEQKKERFNLTLRNAEVMYEKTREKENENFRLIGVTQGYDINSYTEGVKKLLDIGFDYIALGGLVRKKNNFISKLLEEICPIINNEIKKRKKNNKIIGKIGLHLFGIGRMNLFDTMLKFGVTSFDNAYHRKAWQDGSKNYLLNEEYYTALRFRLSSAGYDPHMEGAITDYLAKDNLYKYPLDDFLYLLELYDPKTTLSRKEKYIKLLSEKPWNSCECHLCKKYGIHMAILRRNERNMRRGFHNILHFYKKLRSLDPKIMVLTWCTSKKTTDNNLLPAYIRYSASNTFRTFWLSVYDLPVEINILSAEYGLISWDTLIPSYENRLTIEKVPNIVDELKIELKNYDKIFFIGLGAYRRALEITSKYIDNIEIYPKRKNTARNKLDIIEYNKQMKIFRNDINNEFKNF